MNSKKKKMVIAIIIVLLLLLGAVAGVAGFKYFESRKYHGEGDANTSQATDNTVYYNGKEYEYNTNLTNILFMGIDNNSEIELLNSPGMAGQADCIMILSMDDETKTAKILQISRDSMTDIDIYDTNGTFYTTIHAQLAAQYAYTNSANTSCWAMKKTVKKMLGDIPIAGYISLDIASIPVINNYVGGVTLTMDNDYTDVNPLFVKDATITLNGNQAETFVRYRNVDEKGSNQKRMQRQVQYIPALVDAVADKVNSSDDAADELAMIIEPYVVTDLSTENVYEMASYEWKVENVVYVPGKVVAGEESEEFHIDEEGLQEVLINLFYKLKK